MKKFEAPEIHRYPIVIKDEITASLGGLPEVGGEITHPSNDLEVPEDKV